MSNEGQDGSAHTDALWSEEASPVEHDNDFQEQMQVAMWLGILVVMFVILAAGFVVAIRVKRRRGKHQHTEEQLREAFELDMSFGAIGSAQVLEVEATSGALACVVTAFVPDGSEGAGLALAEGEVVEVTAGAGAGGWLFGRVQGSPSREGCFPEANVCWLGRPVATLDAPAANPHPVPKPPRGSFSADHLQQMQGFVAQAVAAFRPSEVEEPGGLAGHLLQLEEGCIIKVEAGSEGWLYGQVVGCPEVGYFPENRITWLSRPSDSSAGEPPAWTIGNAVA